VTCNQRLTVPGGSTLPVDGQGFHARLAACCQNGSQAASADEVRNQEIVLYMQVR
jgi:hypothetical protein